MRTTPAGAQARNNVHRSRVFSKEDEAYHTKGSKLNEFHRRMPPLAIQKFNVNAGIQGRTAETIQFLQIALRTEIATERHD
jgi:hypothetical protein